MPAEPPVEGGVAVLVVAAGSGTRLGAGIPKAFVRLAGRPLLRWALDQAFGVSGVVQVIVVAPPERVEEAAALAAPTERARLDVVPGGPERSHSVALGLARLRPGVDVVLVHDCARCLAPPEVFERVVAAVRGGAAGVVPGLAVTDTIKQVDADGRVVATPERASLRAVQTPQGFAPDVLARAHAGGALATDDAALVEALGEPVLVVPGSELAAKITGPDDLAWAEDVLARRAAEASVRMGS